MQWVTTPATPWFFQQGSVCARHYANSNVRGIARRCVRVHFRNEPQEGTSLDCCFANQFPSLQHLLLNELDSHFGILIGQSCTDTEHCDAALVLGKLRVMMLMIWKVQQSLSRPPPSCRSAAALVPFSLYITAIGSAAPHCKMKNVWTHARSFDKTSGSCVKNERQLSGSWTASEQAPGPKQLQAEKITFLYEIWAIANRI